MSRSLIQTSNQTSQAVANNGIISLGSVLRRCGCNCKLSGNAIELEGAGYYELAASVSATPTAAGPVTIAFYNNGVQIPGGIAYTTGTAGAPVALPLLTTVKLKCCDSANITCVLEEGAGTIENISVKIVKDF